MSEPLPVTEGRKASSLGERLYAAFDSRTHGPLRFHKQPAWLQSAHEQAAVRFVASLTYAESAGVREALLSSVLLEALKEVLRTGLNGGNNVGLAYLAAGQKELSDELLAKAEESERALDRAVAAIAQAESRASDTPTNTPGA